MKYLILTISFFLMVSVWADTNAVFEMEFPRWGQTVRGGSVYNFETDMDKGGAFSLNRYFVEGSIARMWRFDRMVSFSVGYGQDDYRFSGMPVSKPWNNIDNYRMGLFARWALDDKWVAFAGPSVRSYGEAGVDLEDSITWSFFGGASYVFSERLTLGPGVAVIGQIEEDVRVFPIVIVNWGITERLSLETGGGLAATAGPGLTLKYDFSKHWSAGLTGRYENRRFRLYDEGIAANGVAEDENIPVYGMISYQFYPGGSISTIFGLNMDGELSVDNRNGNNIYKTEYDSSVSLGFVAGFRF